MMFRPSGSLPVFRSSIPTPIRSDLRSLRPLEILDARLQRRRMRRARIRAAERGAGTVERGVQCDRGQGRLPPRSDRSDLRSDPRSFQIPILEI
eukprot:15442730-Alexandrium_andersonii.AAC.1